jgi:hypothetical protein
MCVCVCVTVHVRVLYGNKYVLAFVVSPIKTSSPWMS